MNDENLTSNDLFGSGSDIYGTDVNGGFQNLSNQPDHFPKHDHLLNLKFQDDNETGVKELCDPEDDLANTLDSSTLSIDGVNYAHIHLSKDSDRNQGKGDGFLNEPTGNLDQGPRSGGSENRLADKNEACQPTFDTTLKQPDLPVVKSELLTEYSRITTSPTPHEKGTVEYDNEKVIQLKISQPRISVKDVLVDQNQTILYQKPAVNSVTHTPLHNMADSSWPHTSDTQENGVGARSKIRSPENCKPKTKRKSKGSSSSFKNLENDNIPKPPFKLQRKKYHNEEPESNRSVSDISIDENRLIKNEKDSESQNFPVEFLNPYSDPKAQTTIRPGVNNSLGFPSFAQVQDGNGIHVARTQTVRPKNSGKKLENGSSSMKMRQTNSDPQLHNADRQAIQRDCVHRPVFANSADSIHDHECNSDSKQLLRFGREIATSVTSSNDISTSSETACDNKIVRPKVKTVGDRTASASDKINVNLKEKERKTPTKTKDSVNKEVWRSQHVTGSNSPPRRIQYINNFETNTTKKVENKDMKNTNRSRNMDRNPNVSIVNAQSANSGDLYETVQNHRLIQYDLEQPVIDLKKIALVPESNSDSINRLSTDNTNETRSEQRIIVPYEDERNFVPGMPSLDERFQSNALFGDGTESSDHMFAKMLQEKYDREHEEICQRNQFDIAPDTLLLHNLGTNLNVADGGLGFGDDLHTDSLLNDLNINDVYETSPRTDKSEEDHCELIADSVNSLDEESQRLYPESEVADQFHQDLALHREDDQTYENDHGDRATEENFSDTIHVPYVTEHHREILPPETPDTIYISAEQEEPAERSDESLARSLQRRLELEARQHDEDYARQLEEEEQERVRWNSYRRSRISGRPSSTGSGQPLHARYSTRPLQIRQDPHFYYGDELPHYQGNRQIQNRWQSGGPNIYGNRRRLFRRSSREGYDAYGNEYDPDFMPDRYGDDYVSISRDPHLLATVLMDRAPDMMIPDNVDLDDYEALWDLAEELGEVRRVGMDQEEISLLPVHIYKAPNSAEAAAKEFGDCRVCLTDFSNGERLRTLPCCHIYHVDCIDEWLKRNAVCPVCRQSVRQS